MEADRSVNGDFPKTSIGRSQETRVVSSQDPLTSHPLLSPTPPPSELLATSSLPAPSPHYVPYTPRQRPVTSTATAVSPSIAVSSSSLSNGGATGKLQLQSLKATVQTMGLDNGSIGWTIIEKLFASDLEGPDWDEIWNVIARGQVTLLLPREQASHGFVVTPEFVRDHIAFCNSSSLELSPLVTLGGLRGFVENHSLTLRSSLATSSKRYQAIYNPATRLSGLTSLPPLPTASDPEVSFPFYPISSHLPVLSFPPRPAPVVPPTLPPRPSATAPSRLANPFASLFSKSSSPSPSAAAPSPRPSSPQPPSIRSESSVDSGPISANPYASDGHAVSAFAIEHKIFRKDVGKAVNKATKSYLKTELKGLPSWLPERVLNFTSPLQPFSKGSSAARSPLEQSSPSPKSSTHTAAIVVDNCTAQSTAETIQEFYESIEDDIRKHWTGASRNKRAGDEEAAVDDESIAETDEETSDDIKVRSAMERVEACITQLFYDQLYSPESADDASHDEALASRIAALNMLDLGWEHLGVEIDNGAAGIKGIDEVVSACAKVLEDLHAVNFRSPKAKADLLVNVHKVIADGLARLPPVRLKPDGELDNSHLKTPKQEAFDASVRQASRSPLASPVSQRRTLEPSGISLPPPNSLNSLSPVGSPRSLAPPSLRSISPPPVEALPTPQDDAPELESTPNTPQKGTEVNTDVLLPIIIFSVVKANPVQLVSQLLYVERYRSKRAGGEESFCLINFLAVVEFLEHVDLHALGLGEVDRVMSTQDLTPIPLATGTDVAATVSAPVRLRGRVEQQVEELTTSATKVISGVGGVVDSSFTVLRGLLNVTGEAQTTATNGDGKVTSGGTVSSIITRPGFGLLRRGASFGIANVTANLPSGSNPWADKKSEEGQQMLEVPSRPGSVRNADADGASAYSETGSDDGDSDEDESVNSDSTSPEDRHEDSGFRDRSDTRSIRSFSSMMGKETPEEKKERTSLSNRLATMSGLSRFGGGTPPGSRRSSLLPPARQEISIVTSPPTERISPPNSRFLECSDSELRIGEVPALLAEYRRVVTALRALGGFQDGA